MSSKEIKVQGTTLVGGKLSICLPMVGEDENQLIEEAKMLVTKEPDVVEWRADFFKDIENTDAVVATAQKIRSTLGAIPVVFTIRSEKEGGQSIPINELDKIILIKNICESKMVDIVDYEVENDPKDISMLRDVATANGTKLILSFHDFHKTPTKEEMLEKLEKAATYQADIGKLAVMPNNMNDVLSVLQITQEANEKMEIPILTMSMSGDGALTRMVGWKFGSIFTFAIGNKSSAPGQVPIEAIRDLEKHM